MDAVTIEVDWLLNEALEAEQRAFALRTSAAALRAFVACDVLAAREDFSPLLRGMWARSARNWSWRVTEWAKAA